MRHRHLTFSGGLLILATLLLLSACGGGGGGTSAELNYSGNSNPADISVTNAARLVANVLGSDDAATSVLGNGLLRAEQAPRPARGLVLVSQRLANTLRSGILGGPDLKIIPAVATAVTVDESLPCDDSGGLINLSGTLNDDTLTGSLKVTFDKCLIDGISVNGVATMRIDAVDGFDEPIDFTIDFALLTLRGTGISIDVSGSIRSHTGSSFGEELLTANLVYLDNTTGVMTKTENLVIATSLDDHQLPTTASLTINGRVFESNHGYTDITTLSALTTSLDQAYPHRGQLLLTGRPVNSVESTILVSALSSRMSLLEMDSDGDGLRETSAFVNWQDLNGPAGSDLGDDDADGLHNSWESVNGIAVDPAQDNDADGYSNLREYRGGGDPNNAGVKPVMGQLSLMVAEGISTASSNETNPGRPAVATDGDQYLLISCRELGPEAGLFGVFVAGTNASAAFSIATGDCSSLGGTSENSLSNPAVAFDGNNYLVVFVKGAKIRGVRVSPSGTLLDEAGGFAISSGILFSDANWAPAVAFDGSNYLVAWNSYRDMFYDIYAARVAPDGQVEEEFPVADAAANQLFPDLVFGGENFFLVWQDESSGNSDIFGARITTAATVLDPAGIIIANTVVVEESPRIAFDGSNFLVVWRSILMPNFDPAEAEIHATRIAPDGSLLDGDSTSGGIGISTIESGKSEAALAFDGVNFIVSWVVGAYSNILPAGIYGATVSTNGEILTGLPGTNGVSLSKIPPPFTRFRHPVSASNGVTVLLAWVNNAELSSTTKSIGATLIFP